MMVPVEAGRRAIVGTLVLLVLALGALVSNVAGAALFGDQAPYVGFLDLARQAVPGVALATAAAWLALLGRAALPSAVLGIAALASAAPLLSVGLEQRAAAWVAVGGFGELLAPSVAVLALLFPTGRLAGVPARATTAAVAVLGVACAVTIAVTYDPGGWTWCRCVANPLALSHVGGAHFARVSNLVAGVRLGALVIGVAGLVAVAVGRPQRRGLTLTFEASYAVVAVCWLVADLARLRTVGGDAPRLVSILSDAALTMLAALFAAGYLAQRPSRAHVADLLLAAREEHDTERLQLLVGRAIGDPTARVAWWDPDTHEFRDRAGRTLVVPDRGTLRVEADGRPIALVTAERLDSVETGVRDAVAQALLLAGENRRLAAELQASLDQVRDSRARIVAASDETRRRIERDLHDGAQQLLISTGIKLNVATARAGQVDPALATALGDASGELQRALAELRNLASGIAPTVLVHGTLDNALHELALRSAVPTSVHLDGSPEPDEQLMSTVYFVVAECLANVAKHAGASRASVEVHLDEPLRVTVTDDGCGGATLAGTGSGLRGLVDRVESRGGRIALVSGSTGTTVTATLPARVMAP